MGVGHRREASTRSGRATLDGTSASGRLRYCTPWHHLSVWGRHSPYASTFPRPATTRSTGKPQDLEAILWWLGEEPLRDQLTRSAGLPKNGVLVTRPCPRQKFTENATFQAVHATPIWAPNRVLQCIFLTPPSKPLVREALFGQVDPTAFVN
jgi:hypothetical protein